MEEQSPESAELAPLFKALGDPTRLRIFTFLRACCCPVAVEDDGAVRPVESNGATVGAVCCHVTGTNEDDNRRALPTISFHLKELRQAGLIVMERRGRNMLCSADPRAVARLAAYFESSGFAATSDEPATCCGDD